MIHLVLPRDESWVQLQLLLPPILLIHFLCHNSYRSISILLQLDCSPAKQIIGIQVEQEAEMEYHLDDRKYGSIDHPPEAYDLPPDSV